MGLHAVGTMPPVKMTAYLENETGITWQPRNPSFIQSTYGNATPATCPSINSRTSRNGPSPNVGRVLTNWFGALKYYVNHDQYTNEKA